MNHAQNPKFMLDLNEIPDSSFAIDFNENLPSKIIFDLNETQDFSFTIDLNEAPPPETLPLET